MTSIQTIDCSIPSANRNTAIAFENVQTIIMQATVHEAWIAYSQDALSNPNARFKISKYINNDGSGDSALVLTFPLKPYTGQLYIASAHASEDAKVCVWSISCGNDY
jgi:hypothetical protein